MVCNLKNLHMRYGVVFQPIFQFVLLRITRQERVELTVLRQNANGPVVLVDLLRGWR